jgi:hypothetical protein
MPKLAFNTGEEALRSASQSNNLALAEHKTAVGWLLLGAFMTMGTPLVRKQLSRLKKLWTLTFPSSQEQLEAEKKRGDANTWQLSLESRSGALSTLHSFLVHCNDLITGPDGDTLLNAVMRPIEGAIMLLAQLPSIIRLNNNSIGLRAKAATFRSKLYQTLIALPNPNLYESHYAVILSELVAEFTQADQQQANTVTSTLRSICHTNESILFHNTCCSALQDYDYKLIEDQLQQFSASGSEALEHDTTYLYQKLTNSIQSTTTSASLASYYAVNSNLAYCQAALPLGVSVIDAAIQLYGLMYPKIPNKHRLQILNHFIDLIQKQNSAANSKVTSTTRQALQINIFTAVLGKLAV